MTKNLKKEERRQQIKDAAIRLMSENGYTNTSVQDILDEISYSKSGFYHCFESKEALFREIFADSMQMRYAKVLSLKDKYKDMDRKEFLIQSFLDKLTDYNPYKKLFAKLMIEIATDKKFYKFYKELIDELTAEFEDFCDKNNLPEYKYFVSEEDNVFMTSLMVGVGIFDKYDDANYRAFLKEILMAYFEKKKK